MGIKYMGRKPSGSILFFCRALYHIPSRVNDALLRGCDYWHYKELHFVKYIL